MRRIISPIGIGLAALALAGCGSSKSYALTEVRGCLATEANAVVDEPGDSIAENASGGGVEATIGQNTVTLALGRTEGDAKRMEAGYKVFAEAFESPVSDILSRRGNLVVLWEDTPSESERDALERCL